MQHDPDGSALAHYTGFFKGRKKKFLLLNMVAPVREVFDEIDYRAEPPGVRPSPLSIFTAAASITLSIINMSSCSSFSMSVGFMSAFFIVYERF
jgi:hypothetical protein